MVLEEERYKAHRSGHLPVAADVMEKWLVNVCGPVGADRRREVRHVMSGENWEERYNVCGGEGGLQDNMLLA
jgi:hypothetical protein